MSGVGVTGSCLWHELHGHIADFSIALGRQRQLNCGEQIFNECQL